MEGLGGAVTPVDEEMENVDWEMMGDIWDDISGQRLDPSLVKEARSEELFEFGKHRVYVKVPLEQCLERTGKQPIGVRWVDINKGDEENPEYRSRLVAMDFKTVKLDTIFAATPPLEAKKMLFHLQSQKDSRGME